MFDTDDEDLEPQPEGEGEGPDITELEDDPAYAPDDEDLKSIKGG